MSKNRITYYGGGFIEYARKGRHSDCSFRCVDGDCMNRGSQWFGQICRDVGHSCKDYCSLFSDDTNKSDNKKDNSKNEKDQESQLKATTNFKTAKIGDTVVIHSITQNRNVSIVISESNMSRSAIAEWAIGKSVGSKGNHNGNSFELRQIITKKPNDQKIK